VPDGTPLSHKSGGSDDREAAPGGKEPRPGGIEQNDGRRAAGRPAFAVLNYFVVNVILDKVGPGWRSRSGDVTGALDEALKDEAIDPAIQIRLHKQRKAWNCQDFLDASLARETTEKFRKWIEHRFEWVAKRENSPAKSN